MVIDGSSIIVVTVCYTFGGGCGRFSQGHQRTVKWIRSSGVPGPCASIGRIGCQAGVEEKRMRHSRWAVWVCGVSGVLLAGCGSGTGAPPAGAEQAAAPAGVVAGEGERVVMVPTAEAGRPFLQVNLDTVEWLVTEGNTLGVRTAILEGDPSQEGFYLTINRFPAGVFSRPHYHPDERYGLVIQGQWYTDEGDVFRPHEAVPLGPGSYMRHPAGGHHYDGALDEEVLVAISGYGPTAAVVLDGGDLFGRAE